MKTYIVNKKGIDFRVMVTDNTHTPRDNATVSFIGESLRPVLQKGTKIAELVEEYKKIPIFYGGYDDNTKESLIILPEGPILPIKEETPTAEICRRAYADYSEKDVYMVETSAGRVFYEACNDMSAKKGLYSELGATITLEYRHRRKKASHKQKA